MSETSLSVTLGTGREGPNFVVT